tara:strand:- start:1011 stop:1772 length:762 start_codon:yes stop_codon:yes gene_type:complete
MGRSYKKIIILGKGSVGFYLYNYLIAKGFKNTQIISLRSEGKKISNVIEIVNNSDLIFDCMDRNIGEVDFERSNLIRVIRNNIYEKENIMYLYLSSTNIYSISSNKIDEDGEIASEQLSIYQKNKIKVENEIQKKIHPNNYLIARMPSIWGMEIYNKSFMFDLINSYKKNIVLDSAMNDELIFSYINIQNAVEILCGLFKNSSGIFNIVTEDWASRKDLKLKRINFNLKGKGRKIISKKYDYKEFISDKINLL